MDEASTFVTSGLQVQLPGAAGAANGHEHGIEDLAKTGWNTRVCVCVEGIGRKIGTLTLPDVLKAARLFSAAGGVAGGGMVPFVLCVMCRDLCGRSSGTPLPRRAVHVVCRARAVSVRSFRSNAAVGWDRLRTGD